jgi:hypothetical protein
MMSEQGIALAHTTILRWVQRYVPEFEKRDDRDHRVGRCEVRDASRISEMWSAGDTRSGGVRHSPKLFDSNEEHNMTPCSKPRFFAGGGFWEMQDLLRC